MFFFQLQHFFCTYGYLFELIFAFLTLGDKGVKVSAGYFLRPNSLICAEYPMSRKFFSIHERDRKLGFLNVSLDSIFKFFPIH